MGSINNSKYDCVTHNYLWDGSGAACTQDMSYPGQFVPMYICLSAYMYESGVE